MSALRRTLRLLLLIPTDTRLQGKANREQSQIPTANGMARSPYDSTLMGSYAGGHNATTFTS